MKKQYDLKKLAKIIQAEKAKGKKIVLANGCFDLIHIGHVKYLKGAKTHGDVLVVALNSDRSVHKLKGHGRPILNEQERVEILSSFSFTDYLVIFDEENVEKILLALKPHVHAKGSDYTVETVPEREIVKSFGGKTVIAGGPKIKSTSDVIRKIAAKVRNE